MGCLQICEWHHVPAQWLWNEILPDDPEKFPRNLVFVAILWIIQVHLQQHVQISCGWWPTSGNRKKLRFPLPRAQHWNHHQRDEGFDELSDFELQQQLLMVGGQTSTFGIGSQECPLAYNIHIYHHTYIIYMSVCVESLSGHVMKMMIAELFHCFLFVHHASYPNQVP
jgi:hypothetical protein